ncbi:MAG TPA: hypothetical protein VHG93_04030 [Longimicrobium sp.]|nr:hypothetical protein [Longimicrobium sp.]
MTQTHLPPAPILVCALLAALALAGSVWLARRRGRWLLAAGPLAIAALVGAVTQLPRTDAARPSAPAAAAPQPLSAGPGQSTNQVAAAPPRRPRDAARAMEPVPLGPPPRVVLRGRWTADDSAVVASTLAHSLAQVPAAGGAVLELNGAGRALRPTSRGVQQYAIAATWTLRPAPGAGVLAGSGLGEVLGIGASPDQARRGAATNAAHVIATTLRASLPAPRSAAGASSPSF